ncbi:hypothetical protein [Haloarchaeobius sp. DFWS5]|uniref:hypothetical protein n=1 Tax=Haloarchaeobius sp. DFWS5 TaxID=3446114 RepID=UPI003EBA60E1
MRDKWAGMTLDDPTHQIWNASSTREEIELLIEYRSQATENYGSGGSGGGDWGLGGFGGAFGIGLIALLAIALLAADSGNDLIN